jgi:hypothetical protein
VAETDKHSRNKKGDRIRTRGSYQTGIVEDDIVFHGVELLNVKWDAERYGESVIVADVAVLMEEATPQPKVAVSVPTVEDVQGGADMTQ